MTKRRKKAIIISSVLGGLAVLAFFQAYTAKNLGVGLYEITEVEKNADTTTYDLALKFENPSVLLFLIGETAYSVTVNGEKVGDGVMDPFMLEPLGNKIIRSEFVADTQVFEKYKNTFEDEDSMVTGKSTYSLLLGSFDVPFEHEPTPDQMRQFFNRQAEPAETMELPEAADDTL